MKKLNITLGSERVYMKRLLRPILAVVAILLIPTPCWATKDQARDVATGASVLGGAAALIPTGVTQAAAVGILAGQGVGFLWMGISDWWSSAPTRTVPNNGQLGKVASVTPVQFTPVTGSGQVFTDVNTSLAAGGQLIDNSRLLNISLTLYYSALNVGDSGDAAFQQAAASSFLSNVQSDQLSYRLSLAAISADVQGTSVASMTTTVPEVLALRDQIVASGFPANEAFVFSATQATPTEIANAIQEVSLATGTTLDADALSGAHVLDSLADALGQINVNEMLPTDFQVVPEPTTLTLALVGALGLLVMRPFRRSSK